MKNLCANFSNTATLATLPEAGTRHRFKLWQLICAACISHRLILLGFMASVASLWAVPVLAQERWPANYTAAFNYYSRDLAQLEVTLRHFNDPDIDHSVILRIPRAYVVFADRYEPKKFPQLPSAIATGRVQLALTWPDGKPLSIHAAEQSAQLKTSTAAAIRSLRNQEYAVLLTYIRPGVAWESEVKKTGKYTHRAEEFDGLEHHVGSRQDIYLGQTGVDEFALISCGPRGEALPIHFCKARIRVSERLAAHVDFIDFRLHGGRAFANERVRLLKATICQFVIPACSAR